MASSISSKAKPLLLLKTGSTIDALLKQGEDFAPWFQQGLGLADEQFEVVDVAAGESLPSPEQCAAVVITGSPAFITDLAEWNYIAAQFLREVFALGRPILGVCYGHQLLAWAFGGEVAFNPGARAIGSVEITLAPAAEQDSLLQGLPPSFAVNLSHLQCVTRLPEEAELLLTAPHDGCHGFRLGESCWGLQFHPEFDARITRAYIDQRRELIEGEGLAPDQLSAAVKDTPESAGLLRRFAGLAGF